MANSRSMNAASGINNGEDSDDEIRFIGIENGPGTSSGSNEKIRLIVDQVATNNQQIDVQQVNPKFHPFIIFLILRVHPCSVLQQHWKQSNKR